MITGVVNERHEATIRVVVHHVNGQEQEVEAILDTGFMWFLDFAARRHHSPWSAVADPRQCHSCQWQGGSV